MAGTDGGPELAARRAAVKPGPWSWLHQVHGGDVVVVEGPEPVAGSDGDALVTGRADVVLAVFTADCAPVALSSPEGVIGLVHAGWRGLTARVIERASAVMTAMGATSIVAALGPCIRSGCYEFGADELERVAGQLGDRVRSTTTWGTPSLDLAAGVGDALSRAGVVLVADAGACTACSEAWFSHRARRDTSRQATLLWVPS